MKHTVAVTRVIAAPRAHVFDTFTTHTTYARLPGVLASTLLQPGQGSASNGPGALREIRLPGVTLRERVTGVSRPDYWDYHFVHWPLPFPHAGGRMAFRDVPGGTEVRWETSYDVPEGMAWQLATAGIALGNRGVLKTLIRLLGREAEKTAR